jgi:hypothetical protein
MSSRLKNARFTVRSKSASIFEGASYERIVLPAIEQFPEEGPPSDDLSLDSRFVVVKLEVQQIPDNEARAKVFGHAVDLDEDDAQKPDPIRVDLSLALAPPNFEKLVELVKDLRTHPILLEVGIDGDNVIESVVANGVPLQVQPLSGVSAPAQPNATRATA